MEAMPTPSAMGTSDTYTPKDLYSPKKTADRTTLNTGSRAFAVWVKAMLT